MSDLFQPIDNPLEDSYGSITTAGGLGLAGFISNTLNFIALAGGVLALFNFVIGGIQYINSQGNPESIQKAQKQIYMSVIGLVIIAGSYMIIAIIGKLFYGSYTFFTNPTIKGPGTI